MSYFKQVLCYACREATVLLNALAKPTAAEEASFNLTGWDSPGYLADKTAFGRWVDYTGAKLFNNQMPAIPGSFFLGPRFSGQADYNGTTVVITEGGKYAKSLAAYLWIAATDGLNKDTVCANAFACKAKTQAETQAKHSGRSHVRWETTGRRSK